MNIVRLAPDRSALCQLCDAPVPSVSLEPVVDRTNGQRITVAVCLPCLKLAAKVARTKPQRKGTPSAPARKPVRSLKLRNPLKKGTLFSRPARAVATYTGAA